MNRFTNRTCECARVSSIDYFVWDYSDDEATGNCLVTSHKWLKKLVELELVDVIVLKRGRTLVYFPDVIAISEPETFDVGAALAEAAEISARKLDWDETKDE